MIDFSLYNRRDLSNFLQIAKQADNAGFPLPCWVVEQVVEAHDKHLQRDVGHTPAQPNKKTQLEVYPQGGFCRKHGDALQLRPCGKGFFCPSCHDDRFGVKS